MVELSQGFPPYSEWVTRRGELLEQRIRARKLAQTRLRYKYGFKQPRQWGPVNADVRAAYAGWVGSQPFALSDEPVKIGGMNLYELRSQIRATSSDHWSLIQGGPLFHQDAASISEGEIVSSRHDYRAVLVEDIDIALEWGMRDPNFERWQPDWIHTPDPVARVAFCDVLYRDSLVDRIRVVSIDGGRATVPFPTRQGREQIVLDWDYDLARLLHDLVNMESYDDYVKMTDIVVKQSR